MDTTNTALGEVYHPGLEGVIPIGLDTDHFSICRPLGRDDLIYKRTQACILAVTARSANENNFPCQPKAERSSTTRTAESLGLNRKG